MSFSLQDIFKQKCFQQKISLINCLMYANIQGLTVNSYEHVWSSSLRKTVSSSFC